MYPASISPYELPDPNHAPISSPWPMCGLSIDTPLCSPIQLIRELGDAHICPDAIGHSRNQSGKPQTSLLAFSFTYNDAREVAPNEAEELAEGGPRRVIEEETTENKRQREAAIIAAVEERRKADIEKLCRDQENASALPLHTEHASTSSEDEGDGDLEDALALLEGGRPATMVQPVDLFSPRYTDEYD